MRDFYVFNRMTFNKTRDYHSNLVDVIKHLNNKENIPSQNSLNLSYVTSSLFSCV